MLRTKGVFDFKGEGGAGGVGGGGVKKGCTEKVTLEQRPEGGEGGSPWDMPSRGNSKCKALR